MKLDCHVIEDLLPLYQDQVCSEESRALVEEHLQDCESCSRLLKAMGEPEERKPVYKDEAKPIEAVSKSWRSSKERAAWWACGLTVLVFLIVIGGCFGYQQYHDYFYERNSVVVPADELFIISNETLDSGVLHYQVGVIMDYAEYDTGTCMLSINGTGVEGYQPGTCYVQFKHPRKYSHGNDHMITQDLYAYQMESGGWYVDFSDNGSAYGWEQALEMYDYYDWRFDHDWEGNPITRLVYLDDEGNELVLFDANENYFAQVAETAG